MGCLAMVWPPSEKVEPRYHSLAQWYTRVAGCGVCSVIMLKAYSVWEARWHPPTIHEFVNGKVPAGAWDGSEEVPSRWGQLPYVLLDCSQKATEALDMFHGFEWYGKKSLCPTQGSKRLPYTSTQVPGSVWSSSDSKLLINLTMATPCATLENTWERNARLLVKFSSHSGANNCVLRVSDKPDDLAAASSVSFIVHAGHHQRRIKIRLSRSTRPAPGIYWGMPWDVDPTVNFLKAEWDGELLAGPADGSLEVWMAIDHSGAIIIDKPVGLLPQFLSLVSVWGGFAAAVTAAFLLCFKRQNPPSEMEKQREQLTLRFQSKKPPPGAKLDEGLLTTE